LIKDLNVKIGIRGGLQDVIRHGDRIDDALDVSTRLLHVVTISRGTTFLLSFLSGIDSGSL